jgi:LysR family transcriptional regulator, regulator for metE and metH
MANIAAPPDPALETRDLRLVLALANAGTTAQAAALLHLTQSAVSRALLAVEEKLQTKLFERTPRGLVPTAAGHQLLTGAARLLAELSDLADYVRAPVDAPTRLRIVCECYTAYHWLPSALTILRKTLPAFDVTIEIDHTSNPVAALSSGELDAALLTSATVPRGTLQERPLFSDEIVFAVARGHRLAAQKTLTRADLLANPLLTGQTPAAESAWFMQQVFGRARPKLQLERLPLTEAILDMTRAGMGIAVMSSWIFSPHLASSELVAKRLDTGALLRPWRLAYRREVSDAAQRLLAVLQTAAPRALRVV